MKYYLLKLAILLSVFNATAQKTVIIETKDFMPSAYRQPLRMVALQQAATRLIILPIPATFDWSSDGN